MRGTRPLILWPVTWKSWLKEAVGTPTPTEEEE